MKRQYFDYSATTPVDKRIVKAMELYHLEFFGNPGSLHKFGQEASAAVFKARNKISKLINCDYREIIFTGSATEANNLALRGTLKALIQNLNIKDQNDNAKFKNFKPRIITSVIEHESILETCRELEKSGLAEVIYLPVNKAGIVDLKKLKAALNEKTALVSIMYANNEVGSIQPVKEISEIIKEFKINNLKIKNAGMAYPLFHTDAVQAFNYLDCDIKNIGADLMTLSSQKIYGPKGIGLLYIKNFGNFRGERFIEPIITGGGQEEGLRAGTENVAGIVGFAEAAQIAADTRQKESVRLFKLQNYFWKTIKKNIPAVLLNGQDSGGKRLPNNINVYFPGLEGLIYKLDMAGFAVSGGSACSARLCRPSHVLRALGCSDTKASESVRISFGRQTNKKDIDRLLKILKNKVNLHQ